MSAAILARLNRLACFDHDDLSDTIAALRAVLALCALVKADGGDFVSIDVMLGDIAEALGVADV